VRCNRSPLVLLHLPQGLHLPVEHSSSSSAATTRVQQQVGRSRQPTAQGTQHDDLQPIPFSIPPRFGVLATQARGELEGYPSGSVVEYAADDKVRWQCMLCMLCRGVG